MSLQSNLEEDYIFFENDNIFIDIVSNDINDSYLNEQSKSRKYRNSVHGSINSCCFSLQGLVDSVNTYEEALGIKLISKRKHKKSLAGIALFRDK